MKKVHLIILIFSFYGCTDSTELRKATSFLVKDYNDYEVYIYQKDEFESSTFLYYSIKDMKSDKFVVDKLLLVSTGDYITKSEDFAAEILDSIIYITYLDANCVHAMYDLKTGNKSISILNATEEQKKLNDSLFSRLKSLDKKLVKGL